MLSAAADLDLPEEGARCKASLQAFTQRVIGGLGLREHEADWLHKHDASIDDGNIYLRFPFCFREAFPAVRLEDLRVLALSGILWMSYMRAQDNSIDRPECNYPTLLFLRDLYLRESLHLLYALFSHDSVFWRYYRTYYGEYALSVLSEATDHSTIESAYNAEEFHRIARGKAAMAKYPIAAQAVLSGHDGALHLLIESLDCFHIGYQYWDDVVDWKQDVANSKYSFLLSKALRAAPSEARVLPSDELRRKIAHAVYYGGLADEQLDQASNWLERAYELGAAAGCTRWAAHVKSLQSRTIVLRTDLRSIALKQRSSGAAGR